MDEVRQLIDRATASRCALAEKHRAFGEIVRRFQDLAFGCAYAVLGDFQLAEDAAQDAFVVAWRNLEQLRTPEAFPGWLKRIVLTQCNRLTRGKRVATVGLDAVLDLPSPGPDPLALMEQHAFRDDVRAHIVALPPAERMVTTLFYVNDYSHAEIAAFLELPVTTIKKRLFTARLRLRERMQTPAMPKAKIEETREETREEAGEETRAERQMRDTLRQRRPSNDEQFAGTVALFNAALDQFVAKLKQDPYILAAILFGSLSHDTVWEKSDIDIVLIGRDEKRPSTSELCLVENSINIHAVLFPRSKFKEALEGSLQSSFFHSAFSKSTLLFSRDETIAEYYRDAQHVGTHDREMQLLRESTGVLYTLAKAEKWFHVKKDPTYSALWVLYCANALAKIETLLHGEVTGREVLHQALRHNPEFFNAIYADLMDRKKDLATVGHALDSINAYLDARLPVLFKPVLCYLAEAGGTRSTTELNAYFRKRAQAGSLAFVYEWLADKGVIQKVPGPIRIHPKSPIELQEAAYYYDGPIEDFEDDEREDANETDEDDEIPGSWRPGHKTAHREPRPMNGPGSGAALPPTVLPDRGIADARASARPQDG